MARTTVSEVRNVGDFSSLNDSTIDAFIDDAHTIVDVRIKGAVHKDLLPKVEKWLAAHLTAMRDPTHKEEGVGQSEIVFQGDSGLGLRQTRYGQTVLMYVPEHAVATSSGGHYVRTTKSESDLKPLDEEDPNWDEVH